MNGLKCVHIVNTVTEEHVGSIAYQNKGRHDPKVYLAPDLSKALFSNGQEHYLLMKGDNQDAISWIKNKFIRHVINHENEFYLVTSKDYDRDIDILHAERPKFHASFDRYIEPNLLEVLDSKVILKDEHQTLLQTLIRIGDTVYLDTLDLDMCEHQETPAADQMEDRSPFVRNRLHDNCSNFSPVKLGKHKLSP